MAPDQLFLLCQEPAREGGANVLIDTQILLAEIADADAELHEFLVGTPIDQSEPAFDIVHARSFVSCLRDELKCAVSLPGSIGRGAESPCGTGGSGPERCAEAAASAPGATLAAGELACFDNYRVLHGRRPYVGDERTAHSIWAWTTDAVAVLPMEREFIF